METKKDGIVSPRIRGKLTEDSDERHEDGVADRVSPKKKRYIFKDTTRLSVEDPLRRIKRTRRLDNLREGKGYYLLNLLSPIHNPLTNELGLPSLPLISGSAGSMSLLLTPSLRHKKTTVFKGRKGKIHICSNV